jgi:nonsense-mediated mRNA decay protein 3
MSEIDAASGAFCVVCGRSDVPIEDGVCADCFAKTHDLLEVVDRPTVVLCPTCGARMIGSHWERTGAPGLLTPEDLLPFLRPLEEVGIRRVSWEETGQNPLRRDLRAVATVRFRGAERSVAVEFPVFIEHRTCPECSRKSGRFYTSLIQFRGPEDRPKGSHREDREKLHALWAKHIPDARKEWKAALSWEEERPEGWDFYLVDTLQARGLARWMKGRLGAKLSESPSLYGRKDGRDVYRVTFCLRVPAERIEAEGAPAEPRRTRHERGSSSANGRLERQP